jgi:hypothetical protein
LVNPVQATDTLELPKDGLNGLLQKNSLRGQLREIIFNTLKLYFVIDSTNPGNLRIRLSKNKPCNDSIERSWNQEAVDFMRAAKPIDEFSDGFKSYVGILKEVFCGQYKIFLIDEPEAFLHPPLSQKLGNLISSQCNNQKKQVFAATHSADFVMGCIQSKAPVNIVRLTYQDDKATARVLPHDELLTLMRDPLLRSVGVIRALFFESVIVTEGDSDRVFYQEINERLLEANDSRGISNCLFLNANGKTTLGKIISPLRRLGIPVAGITDLDFFQNGSGEKDRVLSAISYPEVTRKNFGNITRTLKEVDFQQLKTLGLDSLNQENRDAVEIERTSLSSYGLFTVQVGTLEQWLSEIEITSRRKKEFFVQEIFQKMGSDPEARDYVKPTEKDVWAFMGEIKRWLVNPDRKGIPTSTSVQETVLTT